MKKGNYIVISGPSGVGKGTICKQVVENLKLEYSISMTTREKREGEIDGVNYYFTTKDGYDYDEEKYVEDAEATFNRKDSKLFNIKFIAID